LILAAVVGCAAGPGRVLLNGKDGPEAPSATDLAQMYPLGESDNILPILLGRTESLSYHFIQIRDREAPHSHMKHDLIVTLLSGQGALHVEGRAVSMSPGDTAVIRRGQDHFFVNTGERPAAAFVTFAPPYDGQDNVPAH
jgi:mannose-6-phosphate isomerase-like protein (cupin superfamily)